jgi:hypothetical protein
VRLKAWKLPQRVTGVRSPSKTEEAESDKLLAVATAKEMDPLQEEWSCVEG